MAIKFEVVHRFAPKMARKFPDDQTMFSRKRALKFAEFRGTSYFFLDKSDTSA